MRIAAETLQQASDFLSTADPVLGRVIERCGPCTLGSRDREPFHVLATSIINQQLSTKAADTIQRRVENLIGADTGGLTPALLGSATEADLRSCGLSGSKSRWLQTLAQRVLSGELSMAGIAAMDDETAIRELDALPGVGRWTAEMMLIFAFGRLDVFAMDDIGLRRSVEKLYNDGAAMPADAIAAITEGWRPWRSVASWYLWRVADGNVADWA